MLPHLSSGLAHGSPHVLAVTYSQISINLYHSRCGNEQSMTGAMNQTPTFLDQLGQTATKKGQGSSSFRLQTLDPISSVISEERELIGFVGYFQSPTRKPPFPIPDLQLTTYHLRLAVYPHLKLLPTLSVLTPAAFTT